MKKTIKLNSENLSLLPSDVAVPDYDRSELKSGIIHIGPETSPGHTGILHRPDPRTGGNIDWGSVDVDFFLLIKK